MQRAARETASTLFYQNMNLLQKSTTRGFVLPPGLKRDSSDLDSSVDSEDDKSAGLLVGGAKPKLVRKDTFYDKDYDAVKVSCVPQTNEGWLFFMDLLKTEHRKFQLLLTHLRIERMKILKEFEAFTNIVQDAKKMVQLQFETSMKDLKAINIARLLNGDVNKRSSSFVKTTPVKQKRVVSIGATPTKGNTNIAAALTSVRETFADMDEERDDFDSFSDGFSDGTMSVKLSTPSERLNRPRIPTELDEDEKTKRRNKLRKKSMVPTFNVSTQTVDNAISFGNKAGLSSSSRLEKFRKESQLAEQFQYHARPHALSQPFLGFIRKHEKVYAREIGLMRIALREFKGLYDHLKLRLDTTLCAASVETVAPELLHGLQQIQLAFSDGAWVFDPKFFIRKVQMNPLEDPMDVAAQANIINSYEEDAQETSAAIEAAERANDHQTAAHLKDVHTEIKNLMTDLNNRAREKGGWRALLYTAKGEVDMNMSLTPWKPEEQVQILQVKLRSAQQKAAQSEKTHEAVVRQLQETIEQAHSKHRPALYASNKPRAHSHAHGPPVGAGTGTAGRSMSLSGPAAQPKPLDFRAHSSNQQDHSNHVAAGSAHRHTLAHVGAGATPPMTTTAASALVGIAAEMHATSELPSHSRSGTNSHSVDPSLRMPELSDHRDPTIVPPPDGSVGVAIPHGRKPSATNQQVVTDPHLKGSMETVLSTLQSLHASLESSRHQQEQQQDHIRHLHAVIRAQSEQLEARALRGGAGDPHQQGLLHGSVDGGSSLLSLPSQDIIEEYQQLGSPSSNPHAKARAASGEGSPPRSPGVPRGLKVPPMNMVVAHSTSVGGAWDVKQQPLRRGSMLVQPRGDAPLEFVPMGKMGAAHCMRITANKELRDHKHLLLRPTSANPHLGGTAPKSFASIMAGGGGAASNCVAPVGGKAPLNKIAQLEAQKRREQALHVLHHGQPVPPIMSGGLMPLNPSTGHTRVDSPVLSSAAATAPHMQPPSPKNLRRMSNNTIVKELSAIMDDELASTQPSGGGESGGGGGDGDDDSVREIKIHVGAVTMLTGGSSAPRTADDVLTSIQVLCEKLQDALVLQSAALKAGQELLAGVDGSDPPGGRVGVGGVGGAREEDADFLRLHIGESAIDQERSEDNRPRRIERHPLPTSRDALPPRSPQREGGGKGILHQQRQQQQRRPKTAGDTSGSQDSYEDMLIDVLAGGDSLATRKHSDVSVYATTLQNRYLHHVQEAKRLEHAIQRLGKASEEDDIKHQQDTAHAHYASLSLFRPQSAAASLAGQQTAGATALQQNQQQHHHRHKSAADHGAARSHSASATHTAAAAASKRESQQQRKQQQQRGVTAVPFAKVKDSWAPLEGEGGIGADSFYSPRLQEHSAELSNLSEHEL